MSIDALALTSSSLNAALARAGAWELAAVRLGLHQRHGDMASCRTLVHAVCQAEATLRAHSVAHLAPDPSATIHLALRPRGGGWVDGLFGALEDLGLARTLLASEVIHAPMPRVPFVLVCCDADHARPSTDQYTDQFITYPCGRTGCFDPAAFGCLHCSKHGGHGALPLVERCAQRLASEDDLGGGPRRVLFAAPSAPVRDAYRRALLCARKAKTQLPVDACAHPCVAHGVAMPAPCECKHRHRVPSSSLDTMAMRHRTGALGL